MRLTTNAYDLADNIIKVGYPDGTAETFGYDDTGLRAYTNRIGIVTSYSNDVRGLKLYQTNANGIVLWFTYDESGLMKELGDGTLAGPTRYYYDVYGQLTNKWHDELSPSDFLQYTWDANGRLFSRTTTEHGTTYYEYDEVGNLVKIDYPSMQDIDFKYDSLNRLTNMSDGFGVTTFTYDASGRFTGEDGPWVNDTVSSGWNDLRRRTSLSIQRRNGTSWAETFGYDGQGRLSTVSSPSGTFDYKYTNNPSALVQRILFASGAYITNVYDGEGRMRETSLRNSGNSVLNSHKYGYNADSQRTVVTNTGGNYMDYTYDTIGQLKTATGKRANGTTRNHEAFGYHYDDRGNLERKTNNSFVQSFTLGAYNQLSGRSRSGTYTMRGMTSTNASSVTVSLNGGTASSATFYTEDNTFFRNFTLANGNNTFVASGSDANSRTSTDTVTAYLPSTGSFLYDLNGNLTNDQQRVFIYDQENQLTAVLVSNSWKSEFVYDGLGRRRIRKEFEWQNSAWVQSDEVRYIYDGKLVIEERDRFNNPRVTYTRGTDLSGSREDAGGIGGLLARYDHSSLQPALYHADAGGNITAMVNSNQAVVAKYIYDPFGHVLGKSGPLADANLYRFSSKEEHQKSGLVYYLYRYYDPLLQRWINRDPIAEEGGINVYKFNENDPINRLDAFGELSFNFRDWSPLYYIFEDENTEMEEALEEGRGGDDNYRHCLASCRAARRLGPLGGAAAIEGWNITQEYPRFNTIHHNDSIHDIQANWDGWRKAWNIFKSCRERCRTCPRR